jgi:glutathione S-transferase
MILSVIRPSIDFGYPTGPYGRIPAFNNIEEEAEFWDTHDITDYLHEMEPVNLVLGGELAEQARVRRERIRHAASENSPK